MKSFLFITVGSIIAITNTNGQQYKCAPAQHCDPRSALCKSTEYLHALISGLPPPGESFETSRGICTDAYKWVCNQGGTRCQQKQYSVKEVEQRCWEILYTDREGRADNKVLTPRMFIEACPSNYYTCNSGSCVKNPSECGVCSGIECEICENDPNSPDCKRGVRFDKVRCEKNACGTDDILTRTCDFKSETVLDNEECRGDSSIDSDACCVKDTGAECEYILMQKTQSEIKPQECGTVCVPPVCEEGSGSGSGSGSGTSNPAASPTSPTVPTVAPSDDVPLYAVTALELNFQFKDSSADCCCRLSCDCFGDPHCTNFFGSQQTSKLSVGSYRMYEEGDFSLTAVLGEPQGVVAEIVVKVTGSPITYSLNMINCHNNTYNWKNVDTNKFIPKKDLPKNWEIQPSVGNKFANPNIYIVRDATAEVAVLTRCVSWFYQKVDGSSKYVEVSRLDVQVTKWSDLTGEQCCPTEEQNKEWFASNNAVGYCVGNENLPGAANKNNKGAAVILDANLGEISDISSVTSNDVFDNEQAQKLCEEYLQAVKDAGVAAVAELSDMQKCIQNVLDFGITSLQKLIDAIKNEEIGCIADANDPLLLIPFSTCTTGAILQIKKPKTNNWINFRYIASSYKYCDNRLGFDFSRTYTEDGTRVTAEWEFRLQRCKPDMEECGVCEPVPGFMDIQFKWLYDCIAYDTLKDTVEIAMLNALKEGGLTCGFNYNKNLDPLACMKDKFPEYFPSTGKPTVVVGEQPTKKPTIKPTQVGETKSPVAPTNSKPPTQSLKKCGDILKEPNCIARPGCKWALDDRGKMSCMKK